MEESGQLDAPTSFTLGINLPVPIEQEGGRFGEEADLFFRIFEPVTFRYTECPTQIPIYIYIFGIPGKCSYRRA